jgi:hypothetical protein
MPPGATSVSDLTRSPARMAISAATAPPIEWPAQVKPRRHASLIERGKDRLGHPPGAAAPFRIERTAMTRQIHRDHPHAPGNCGDDPVPGMRPIRQSRAAAPAALPPASGCARIPSSAVPLIALCQELVSRLQGFERQTAARQNDHGSRRPPREVRFALNPSGRRQAHGWRPTPRPASEAATMFVLMPAP